MSATFIATTPRGSYNALKYQGILVTECFEQISATLSKNLGPGFAAIFAQPFHTQSGEDIDWYSAAVGPVVALSSLPEARQQEIKQSLAASGAAIAQLAAALKQSPDHTSVTRGHILELALTYPAFDNVYVVGAQPVITYWGFVPASMGVAPQDLMRAGVVKEGNAPPAQQPPALQQAQAEELVLSAPGPQREAEPQPASAWPAQPKPHEPERHLREGMPIWLRGLLWALLALALTLLLLFLLSRIPQENLPEAFKGCAGKPAPTAPPAPTLSPEASPELAAAMGQEAALRKRLQELRLLLMRKAANCQKPPENKPAEKPAPQPEVKPELKPEIKPEVKPEVKPEIKPEVKPEVKPEEPKPNQPLSIPPRAAEEKDLSFLKGCWINSSKLYSRGGSSGQIEAEYCFDEAGNGSRSITQQDGSRCAGPVRARFTSGGQLSITADGAPCNQGRGVYVPQRVECSGQGNATNCVGREEGDNSGKWKAEFRRK